MSELQKPEYHLVDKDGVPTFELEDDVPTFRVTTQDDRTVLVPEFNEPSLTQTERDVYDRIRSEWGVDGGIRIIGLEPSVGHNGIVSLWEAEYRHENPTLAMQVEQVRYYALLCLLPVYELVEPAMRWIVETLSRVVSSDSDR